MNGGRRDEQADFACCDINTEWLEASSSSLLLKQMQRVQTSRSVLLTRVSVRVPQVPNDTMPWQRIMQQHRLPCDACCELDSKIFSSMLSRTYPRQRLFLYLPSLQTFLLKRCSSPRLL